MRQVYAQVLYLEGQAAGEVVDLGVGVCPPEDGTHDRCDRQPNGVHPAARLCSLRQGQGHRSSACAGLQPCAPGLPIPSLAALCNGTTTHDSGTLDTSAAHVKRTSSSAMMPNRHQGEAQHA